MCEHANFYFFTLSLTSLNIFLNLIIVYFIPSFFWLTLLILTIFICYYYIYFLFIALFIYLLLLWCITYPTSLRKLVPKLSLIIYIFIVLFIYLLLHVFPAPFAELVNQQETKVTQHRRNLKESQVIFPNFQNKA